jgi:uncharacterized protein (TIGR02246 family)
MLANRLVVRGLTIVAVVAAQAVCAAQDAARKQDEQAIRAAAKEYLAALARGDAKAIAQSWTADGQFVDAEGRTHAAAELAAEATPPKDDAPRPQVNVIASSIRFITADVAVEDGASEITWPEATEPPTRGRFHATWVKQQGRWRLASLCEMADAPAGPLADLAWMVGTWRAEQDGTQFDAVVKWNDAGTALVRETQALRDGHLMLSSSQIVSWNPRTHQVQSWSFDPQGGHAEGTWSRDGEAWIEQVAGVLPDGRETSATVRITPDGPDAFTRKLTETHVDGEAVGDQEVRFKRLSESQ